MTDRTRRELLALAGAGTAALAGCLGSVGDAGTDDSTDPEDVVGPIEGGDDAETRNWRTAEFEDVRTGESFAIAEFDRPVVLTTFATWCGVCQNQHEEIAAFHDEVGDEAVSVELNVDQNEDPALVRDHVETNGFDWHFAVSPPAVTRSLVDEFGRRMSIPTTSPTVVVCPDGEIHTAGDEYVVPAAAIADAVENC